jgi:hypothetical protein
MSSIPIRSPLTGTTETKRSTPVLAAWAVLLARYVDVDHPYFGYTSCAEDWREDRSICHVSLDNSMTVQALLSSVTLQPSENTPAAGVEQPILNCNTRVIESPPGWDLGDTREMEFVR